MSAFTLVFVWFFVIFYIHNAISVRSGEARAEKLETEISAQPAGTEKTKKTIDLEALKASLKEKRTRLEPSKSANHTANLLLEIWPASLAMTLVNLALVSVIRVKKEGA